MEISFSFLFSGDATVDVWRKALVVFKCELHRDSVYECSRHFVLEQSQQRS
jgi:hypothetical protein